jgi:hypothetical protein
MMPFQKRLYGAGYRWVYAPRLKPKRCFLGPSGRMNSFSQLIFIICEGRPRTILIRPSEAASESWNSLDCFPVPGP